MADSQTLINADANLVTLDEVVTGTGESATNRVGASILTLAEVDRRFNESLANLGLEYPPIAYTSGLTVERNTQTFSFNNVIYINTRQDLPFTVTGSFDEGGWQIVQQVNQSTVIFTSDGIKGLENVALIDRASYSVSGFYAGTEAGGGQFVYDASRPKSDNNGGTVITPEAIAAWDGTQGNLSALLDWTGTGTGAFVRLGGGTSTAAWGVIPENTNTMIGLQAQLDSGLIPVNLEQSREYVLNDAITSRLKDVTINFNGSWLVQNNESTIALDLSGGYESIQSITSISFVGGATEIVVADASAYGIGDVAKIVDEQDNPDFPAGKQGEYVVIDSIDETNNLVRVLGRLYFDYSTSSDARIGKLNNSKIILNGLKVKGPDPSVAGETFNASHLVVIEAALRPEVNAPEMTNVYNSGINFRSCYQYKCHNPSVAFAADSGSSYFSSSNYTGYMIRDTASEYGEILSPSINHARHGIVYIGPDGGYFDSGLTNYGESAHNKTVGGSGIGCTISPFDFHHGSRFNRYISPTAKNNVLGASVRGVRNDIIDAEFEGNAIDWRAFVQTTGRATRDCYISFSSDNPRTKMFEVREGATGIRTDYKVTITGSASELTHFAHLYGTEPVYFGRVVYDVRGATSIVSNRLIDTISDDLNPLYLDKMEVYGDLSGLVVGIFGDIDEANSCIREITLYDTSGDFSLIQDTFNYNATWNAGGPVSGPYLKFGDKSFRIGYNQAS